MPEPLPRMLVSVCKGSECCDRGADALFETLRVAAAPAGARVRVTRGGCWGLCNLGPNVVVRQDAAAAAVEGNVFGGDASFSGKVGEFCYGAMDVASAERVAQEHVLAGQPVRERLLTAEQRKTAVKLSKD